ncbi:peptidyl-prolyl cis-trans isomerase [Candidatus Rickettsiella viridis]|uniref:Peptidyl-prolyl cis-trans isomerase n=1 Tax=Candidatus Rickettsiella viridis TaxID=676208 RepID=A0A2Z5UUT0_9COXI|nr:SurA N-terminal domain-containing protein [Candidatus Rickettsiella viridis]BBB14805.1 peptidyl-prolyl cis-trans isomerase [Candidatus Rickettsiella viridis]
MLQSIRDRTHGWLTSVVIGLLIIMFALWGVHGYLELQNEGGDKVVAKVAGQKLSQREFDVAYQRVYQQAKAQLGTESLNKELVKQLKKQTLEQWMLTQVLAHAAAEDRYRLSPSSIDSVLLHMPLFQSAGRFSSARFYAVLDAMGYTELGFLSDLKKTLLINQVQQGLTGTAFVLPSEVSQAMALIHQKRDFAYIVIPSSQFSAEQLPISEAQALAYYQKNTNHFVQPEQVSIDYIKLSLAALKDDKTFVERRDKLANLSYTHPDSLQQAAQALNLPIQSTPLFGQKGGNDVLTKNPKIIAAAFSQDSLQGNNSPVIDLDADTAIVLRVKQHKASAIQAFSAVKTHIIDMLRKQQVIEKNYTLGQGLLKELKEKGSFSDSEKNKRDLHWQLLNQVERNTDKPSAEIVKAVFNLPATKNEIAGFALANGDYVLIKLLGVHEGDSQQYPSSQKNMATQALEREFARRDYDLYVQGLMQKAHSVS